MSIQGEGAFAMQELRDSFARRRADHARDVANGARKAASELRQDMQALWTRVGVVERKTVGITRIGTCGLCGEPAKKRYCEQCLPYWEGVE